MRKRNKTTGLLALLTTAALSSIGCIGSHVKAGIEYIIPRNEASSFIALGVKFGSKLNERVSLITGVGHATEANENSFGDRIDVNTTTITGEARFDIKKGFYVEINATNYRDDVTVTVNDVVVIDEKRSRTQIEGGFGYEGKTFDAGIKFSENGTLIGANYIFRF